MSNNYRYRDNELCLYLDNYWLLVEGSLPFEPSVTRNQGSPFETACVIKADIDRAIDSLSSGKWYALKEYNKEDWVNNTRLVYRLGHRQQAVVRYHFLGQEYEYFNAIRARRAMLKFLNENLSFVEVK